MANTYVSPLSRPATDSIKGIKKVLYKMLKSEVKIEDTKTSYG